MTSLDAQVNAMRSIAARCYHVDEQCRKINEQRARARELHEYLPQLLVSLFGFHDGRGGWIAKAHASRDDYDAVVTLLRPDGAFFRLLLAQRSAPHMRYAFPVARLPRNTAALISARQFSRLPPLYHGKLDTTSTTRGDGFGGIGGSGGGNSSVGGGGGGYYQQRQSPSSPSSPGGGGVAPTHITLDIFEYYLFCFMSFPIVTTAANRYAKRGGGGSRGGYNWTTGVGSRVAAAPWRPNEDLYIRILVKYLDFIHGNMAEPKKPRISSGLGSSRRSLRSTTNYGVWSTLASGAASIFGFDGDSTITTTTTT
eukprot:CAMPEP_0198328522 /NCGR_PEP_ID=MMETSP1450-20131203/15537_1 /TAXON_ID=753684 ORGANISM="Madagascaria erythrocladiodes, Strain CCMP3234" /NCGR_SAMPLE_ID=MMETSP1450 /ASSEMBLY_ACC=CAM_ASM_001115 /LENGTH=310 /DNA_ID=CAMNT_0044032665 /DNA_START=24 /DNA_END=953 /DNA_ORIENTATION=-